MRDGERRRNALVNLLNHPILVFVLSLLVFWFSGFLGARFRERCVNLDEGTRADLTFVLGSALALLGLIIGFTFSMAVSRYDQRKNAEAAEANAIGTEYVRADFLPAQDAAKIHALLKIILISESSVTRSAVNKSWTPTPELSGCSLKCGQPSPHLRRRRL